MSESDREVTIAMRIPGPWGEPKELLAKLPKDHRLTPETLVLPDGAQIEFGALPPDDQFPGIFRGACRNQPTKEELAGVDGYQVNVTLSGPGGSMESAHAMMKAAAALVRAGGAGVFIDNGARAHGAGQWLELTEDGGADALSFAFVAIVGGQTEIHTMGMHALGQPEIVMKRSDADEFDPIEMIRYLCTSDKQIGDGHIIADEDGLRFKVVAQNNAEFQPGSPFHNPFGMLKLVTLKDIAEKN